LTNAPKRDVGYGGPVPPTPNSYLVGDEVRIPGTDRKLDR
jgi:hypothetical protein